MIGHVADSGKSYALPCTPGHEALYVACSDPAGCGVWGCDEGGVGGWYPLRRARASGQSISDNHGEPWTALLSCRKHERYKSTLHTAQ